MGNKVSRKIYPLCNTQNATRRNTIDYGVMITQLNESDVIKLNAFCLHQYAKTGERNMKPQFKAVGRYLDGHGRKPSGLESLEGIDPAKRIGITGLNVYG